MKIVQFGISRTGTTVIWQCLREIFPRTRIVKTHIFDKGGARAVVTVRDFRDVLVSNYAVACSKKKLRIEKITDKFVIDKLVKIISKGEALLQKYLNYYKKRCLCLSYEHFFKNFEYIFEEFSKFFELDIDRELRSSIEEKYSIEANKKIADKLKDFSSWDPVSLIHGHHILKGTPENWVNLVSEDLHPYLNQSLKSLLKKWRY